MKADQRWEKWETIGKCENLISFCPCFKQEVGFTNPGLEANFALKEHEQSSKSNKPIEL